MKTKFLHRILSAVLAVAMLLSANVVTAFAAGTDTETKEAIYLGVPAEVEDGVYYAEVNMKNATNPSKQYSMGNAALRGSVSYKQKQPEDTEYRPIVIVKDGKATALLEFMPMGYIGMYGFMMELEGVYPGSFTRYGSPNAKDENTVFTKTQTLTYQKTVDGKIVYDGYNDPDSDYKFDGSELRPAGFGKEESYLDIVDQYYTHLLALDVTPVMVKNGDDTIPVAAADYTGDHAAFCHVFVPVMFDISPTSGDQYARMEVNWQTLEKIEEPENNVQYMLYKASQTATDGYTEASVSAFEEAYTEVREALENVWGKQRLELSGSGFAAQPVLDLKTYTEAEQVAMAQKLKSAIDGLVALADKTALDSKIAEAKELREADYTTTTFSTLRTALRSAQLVSRDEEATQEEVDKALASLESAIAALVQNTAAEKYKILYSKAESLDSADYTEESWAAFEKVWEGKKNTKDISKLPAFMQNATVSSLEKAIDALVEKPTLDTDPTKLADGKYTLKAYMYKAAQPEVYSMSNNAINHNVWLEVKDGQYYLTVQFVGMSIYNKFGYLKYLKYYDAGYTYDTTGQPQGVLKDVEVLSTQKNRAGEDIIDKYNSAGDLYPALVRFPLVDKADGEYVPLQVFVPIMDSIAAGLGTQNALMELDWTKLRLDDGSVQPMEPPVQSPALKATDETTGISVDAEAGVFEEDTKLVTEKIESGTLYDTTASRLETVGEKFTLYNIGFKDYAGEYVLPNGSFKIKIPVPAGYDTDKIKIYRINDDEDNIGPKTLMGSVTIENGYMETLVLQKAAKPFHYAVVEAGSKLPVPGDFTALNAKIAEAKELLKNSDFYTADSVKKVNDAVVYAESLASDTEQAAIDAALEGLTSAIAGLTYRDADYSKVDAAIAAIPSDLSQYTDETAAAVTAAVNAIVRNKNITEQSEVDAMADAINEAVAKLEKKNDGSLDFKNLPDGVYSITFSMVKMNRNDLSMSNDAVNHTAKLTVKNGNYTLTVNFKGLHYLNRFGYLAKLSYYDDGYTYGEYGAVNGVLKTATVVSVQKNADGSDVTDEFNVPGGSAEGVKYPETISFPLVNTAKADAEGYVPLHVFVPVMEDISEGSGDQDVLMKLDFASLKKTTDDDSAFEPEKPEELSPAVDITDEKTGVRVRADKGVLPEGVKLIVTEITSGADYNTAASALSDIGKKFKLYNISFTDKDGNEISSDVAFTVTFPVPSGYNAEALALYRINADGTKTLVKGSVDGNGYSVATKSVGNLVLVEKGSTVSDKNPDTSDRNEVLLWGMLMTAFAGIFTVAFAKKRNLEKGE